MQYKFILFLLCLFLGAGLFAQSVAPDGPYHLSFKRELGYGGLGALTIGAGVWLQNRIDEPLLADLSTSSLPCTKRRFCPRG